MNTKIAKKNIFGILFISFVFFLVFLGVKVEADDCPEEDPNCNSSGVICWDGTWAASYAECPGDPDEFICPDGSIVSDIADCPEEDVCPDVPGIQTDIAACDVCSNKEGQQNSLDECDVCADKPGIQYYPEECNCDPNTDPDSCRIYYCADSEANNQQDAFLCEQNNAQSIAMGYSCYGSYGLPICSYDPVEYCPPTTQSQCAAENPDRECVEGSMCSHEDTCFWESSITVTCGSGATYTTTVSGSYTYDSSTSSCAAPDPLSDDVLISTAASYCSNLTPPDIACSVGDPDCHEIDFCPQIEGNQTDPSECQNTNDMCANIEGFQAEIPTDYSRDASGNCYCSGTSCMDYCPNIDGIQAPGSYQKGSNGNCAICTDGGGCCDGDYPACCTGDSCIGDPDKCLNIDGIQPTVPNGFTWDSTTNYCYEIMCGPGTAMCVSQNACIPVEEPCDPPPEDQCINMEGLQVTVPDGYTQNGSKECTCSGGTCCTSGTTYCASSEQCIPDVDICNPDKCLNIEGIQYTVPQGFTANGFGVCTIVEIDDNICVMDPSACIEPVDKCYNLTGIQLVVPDGFYRDLLGNCTNECVSGTSNCNGTCMISGSMCIDVCDNIPGFQPTIPTNFILKDGACVIGSGDDFCNPEVLCNQECVPYGTSCPIDQCLNMEGVQTSVPAGYTRDSNGNCNCSGDSCVIIVDPDVCPNIDGFQLSLPSGFAKNGDGDCICSGPSCNNDLCPNITGMQIEVPNDYAINNQGECVCDGDSCGSDMCPNITGIQLSMPTDYTLNGFGQCVCSGYSCTADQCLNIEGVQLEVPAGYDVNEAQECTCPGGSCLEVNGACGYLDGRIIGLGESITGTNACDSGTRSDLEGGENSYTWTCLGSNGGSDSSICSASIGCESEDEYYCDQTGTCIPLADSCNIVEPPGDNTLIGGLKGTVLLKNNLKVTTLIKQGESCTVEWGMSSGVIERYNENTHCVILNQDFTLASFDPQTVGSTTSVLKQINTVNVTDITLVQPNVKKDTVYKLKCWQGAETENTVYAVSQGSCRLNVRSIEYN